MEDCNNVDLKQKIQATGKSICLKCIHNKVCRGIDNQPCIECNQFLTIDDLKTIVKNFTKQLVKEFIKTED